jgi:hypothetical protein
MARAGLPDQAPRRRGLDLKQAVTEARKAAGKKSWEPAKKRPVRLDPYGSHGRRDRCPLLPSCCYRGPLRSATFFPAAADVLEGVRLPPLSAPLCSVDRCVSLRFFQAPAEYFGGGGGRGSRLGCGFELGEGRRGHRYQVLDAILTASDEPNGSGRVGRLHARGPAAAPAAITGADNGLAIFGGGGDF